MIRNIAILALLGLVNTKYAPLYEHAHSDVSVFTTLNFDKQVTKNRQDGISIVHFYKHDDGKSPAMKDAYKAFATENMGLFRIGSMDCAD